MNTDEQVAALYESQVFDQPSILVDFLGRNSGDFAEATAKIIPRERSVLAICAAGWALARRGTVAKVALALAANWMELIAEHSKELCRTPIGALTFDQAGFLQRSLADLEESFQRFVPSQMVVFFDNER